MRRKSGKYFSAVLNVRVTLELGKLVVSFWLPRRTVVMIHSHGICGHSVGRNVIRTRAHAVSEPRKPVPRIGMKSFRDHY
jgi:hypothetical protein